MSRLAPTATLATALVAALSLTASADAGKKHNAFNLSNLSKIAGSQITLPGGPGFKPPCVRPPVHPPIHPPVQPPIIRPPVRPPVFPPITPPIVCPKPPIVLPPRPPIVLPPPVVCPKPPIVLPPAPPIVVCPPKPPVILPPPTTICPPTHVGYRFGMTLQRVQTQYGVGLQVVSVEHASPAWHAQLQPGHVLLAANNQSLAHATSNEHGVQLLHAAVNAGQPVAAAAPAVTLVSTGATQATPTVMLNVLNPLTNQLRAFYVTPEIVGGAPPPAAAAPVALNPGQPTATL